MNETPKFLKHKINGSVWPYSEGLKRNRNMVECDENGHELALKEKYPDPFLSSSEPPPPPQQTKNDRDSLDEMDKDALLAFATLNEIDVDKRMGVERLREAVRAAMLAKG